jgi:hypothetical protein
MSIPFWRVLGGRRRAAGNRHALAHSHAAGAAQPDAARGYQYACRVKQPGAIINEGMLTVGWVGPALLGILIAAFGWAGRVFEWLGTLAMWLFSGDWRDRGPVER